MTRLGLLGLAVAAVSAVGASPAAAVTRTATYNQCTSTFAPIPDSTAVATPNGATSVFVDVPKIKGKIQDGVVTAFRTAGLRITHTFDSDLSVLLVSPGGKAVTLANERGEEGDGFGSGAASCAGNRVFFGDAFTTSITTPGNTGDNPVLGFFKPEGFLSSFVGGPARGFWTVIAQDTVGGDTGSINALSLDFDYSYNAKKKKKGKK